MKLSGWVRGFFSSLFYLLIFAGSFLSFPAFAYEKALTGHMPRALQHLAPVASLEATNYVDLSLGLQVQDPEGLALLLDQIYDPASPLYHQYLRPEEFAARFAPAEADYQQLIAFAGDNGFTITSTHPNRTLLGVRASVRDVEHAFGVKMRVYQHPKEARLFFSNDSDP